jgi:hypothetical protein
VIPGGSLGDTDFLASTQPEVPPSLSRHASILLVRG